MKTRIILGLSTVFCLLLVSTDRAAAQGCQPQKYYSSYVSDSLGGSTDSNLTIYQDVTTDGYASMDLEYCPAARYATHTPWVHNQLTDPYGHTYGGNYSGPSGCVNCYLSEQNTLSVAATEGEQFTYDGCGYVVCSIAGEFWEVCDSGTKKLVHTNEQYQSEEPDPADPSQKFCNYTMVCPNGNDKATCPAQKTILGPVEITFHCPAYYHCYYLVKNGVCEDVTICIPAADAKNCS